LKEATNYIPYIKLLFLKKLISLFLIVGYRPDSVEDDARVFS